MCSNEIVVRLNPIQADILKTISILILEREKEDNNNKKTTINANSISKKSGRSYNSCKKYLKQLKDML